MTIMRTVFLSKLAFAFLYCKELEQDNMHWGDCRNSICEWLSIDFSPHTPGMPGAENKLENCHK